MSNSKLKYFEVTTTTVVKANNKADAVAIANRRKGYTSLEGSALQSTTSAERVRAQSVKSASA